MKRPLSLTISVILVLAGAALFYLSRPVVIAKEDTPLWESEYDESRQGTIFPGSGTPLGQLKAGDHLRVLWDKYGKDDHALFVVGPHWRKGWMLDRQDGIRIRP